MTYPQAVQYLLSLLGDIRAAHFGLGRMEALLARLGEPQRHFRLVHVAGTNGKGSTAAMIESGLRAAGHSTGLYTSPHLIRFNERVRINGQDIDDAGFARCVEEVRAANESLIASKGRQEHPTFFETVTAATFCGLRNAGVDWGVIEVGLGGRLDATNVVRPEVAVITRVSLDHEAFLGKGLSTIAAEKAGILKPGCKAVMAMQVPQAALVIEARAKEVGVELTRAGADWKAEDLESVEGRYRFRVQPYVSGQPSRPGITVELGLAGEHQVENALTAVAVLDTFGVAASAIRQGLRQVRWPARLERIDGPPEILLDAAHNPSGARVLARFLDQHERGRRKWLLYGAARDKAVEEVADPLFPHFERVVLTRAKVERAVDPEVLRHIVDHLHDSIDTAPDVEQALRVARQNAEPDDLIVVAGSVFLVGEAKEILERVALAGP